MEFDPDLSVHVGLNAEGKTSVLDAVAIAPGPVMAGFGQPATGFKESDVHTAAHNLDSASAVATLEHVYPVHAEMSATIARAHYTWARERVSKGGRKAWGGDGVRSHVKRVADVATGSANSDVVLPVFAYYGVERLVGVRRDRGTIPTSRPGAYAAALDPKSDLTRLGTNLQSLTTLAAMDLARDQGVSTPVRAQLAAIDAACEAAIGEFRWHKPAWDPLVGAITLRPIADGVPLPLDWLSIGLRIMAGLVIDLASRMARASPHLGGDELLRCSPGIVLIDEVDLHLHPQWQKHIIRNLRAAFPRVQFIVTTHSPQVLSTVPARSIKILADRKVTTPHFSEGLRADVVLQSLLRTSPEPPTEKKRRLGKYLELVHDDRGETAEAHRMRRELDVEMGGASRVPELGEADAYMAVFGGE